MGLYLKTQMQYIYAMIPGICIWNELSQDSGPGI